jgi:PAS domain S-box-containing protein
MPIVDFELAPLRHPRLAALATSARPAWVWSADGSQIIWANAAGAGVFGATTIQAIRERRFSAHAAPAIQVTRLATTLPPGGRERLDRLRGFGASFGRALTCICSRIALGGGGDAVLIAAAEPAGPALALGERVRRLFADRAEAIAAFEPSGTAVYANAAARALFDSAGFSGAVTLPALGLAALALRESDGARMHLGQTSAAVSAEHLGTENSRVVVLTFTPQRAEASRLDTAPQMSSETPTTTEGAPLAAQMSAALPAASGEAALPAASGEHVSAAPDREPGVPPAPAAFAQSNETFPERRHPLRFVWHMDTAGHFGIGSDEFIELVGPQTTAVLGRPWSEITSELKLDPNNNVARAVATHETWSGLVVFWPVDNSDERLPVELSGLPVFDRERIFQGYRGFGVCRDVERINEWLRRRRQIAGGFVEEAKETMEASPAAELAVAASEPRRIAADTSEISDADRAPPERSAANVVPFRPSAPVDAKSTPTLSPIERRAFRELAQELTARLRAPGSVADDNAAAPAAEPAAATIAPALDVSPERGEQILLDRIPVGILVCRHAALLFANRHFLAWSGYDTREAIEAAGGPTALFAEPDALTETDGARTLSMRTQGGTIEAVEGRMVSVPWRGAPALALILTNGQAEALRIARRELPAAERENYEIKSVLDAVTDGIVTLDRQGTIVAANARAVALFGRAAEAMPGRSLGELLAPESERAARDYLDRVAAGTTILDKALDVAARIGDERLMPLAVTLTRIGSDRFCAVFRDVTAGKQSEEELRNARREAAKAAEAKTKFLAKISHEIRTPLNAMIGFAEVVKAERFGPIGNERYREYVKDIVGAGTHLVSLLNDLLDLSRIEGGKVDLNFTNVNLNDLTQQCVGIMQPEANRARIIIRTALTPALPQVVADERSMRQIVLNLLSNSIKLTGPGGQVIVSTVFSDAREAVLRVRDTGVGMSEQDIQAALEPFRESATSGSLGSGGSGFGLPLTRAIAEANGAHFSISSAPNAGTLVEIAFPPSRVAAE